MISNKKTSSEKGDLYAQDERYETDLDPETPAKEGVEPRTSRDVATTSEVDVSGEPSAPDHTRDGRRRDG